MDDSYGLAAVIAVCDLPAPNRPLRWHMPAGGPPPWDDCDAQSVGALKHSSFLVESAGQNIRNIVTCVLEVSSSVESIRDNTHEQMVEGVKHIHAAENGLDKATQQNAATVQ